MFWAEQCVLSDHPRAQTIWDIHRDRLGRLWIAGNDGAAFYREELDEWQFIEGLNGRVLVIEESPSGMLWFGTYRHGIYQWDGDLLVSTGTAEGLPNREVNALQSDGNEGGWVGTLSRKTNHIGD